MTPNYKRFMGLDLGSKTIGVALSDLIGLTAQAHSVIQRAGLEEDLRQLRGIIESYEVALIVLGLPKNMNNTIGPQGEASRAFADLLRAHFGIDVILWDERLTSREAERLMLESGVRRERRRQVIDKLAAVLILQSYLRSRESNP